ncbi:uncharacterized protein LOC123895538 isoform X2 [Trifolium pratense]|uniref:uncharacterized protein LOC123895538 isoform X2 n=1 Tax=Trifolium pratense TaxID=57577 RepID=UPI001E6924F6|nr:uncharacterized protein LOC123895538 isoform X2 [Trifolium pratense]
MMEQSRFDKQLQCNTMEPRNEEIQPGSQSIMQDYLDSMYANKSDIKQVRNYSIQTGEEFSLEFMRDRANLTKPVFSNVSDSNSTTNGMEPKGVLGISHAGFENGSGVSMLPTVDRGLTEFNRQSTWLHGDRSNYGSIRSTPRTLLNQDSGQFGRGCGSYGGSDCSSRMMKCLCSFGGRILPRPSDGKLRYVGGQTRILRLRKDISWPELRQRALLIYNLVHILKYQLPGEDLDALVSVSSDEDLQNMMEEYNLIEDRDPPQKLRIFLFSMSDLKDAQFALSSIGDDSEFQYVVAVNGMDLGSRNNSTPLGVSISANGIREFDKKAIERETSNVALESIGVRNAPLTNKSDTPLATKSPQQVLPTSIGVRNAPSTNKSDIPLDTRSSQQVLPTSIGDRSAHLTNKSDTALDAHSSQQVLPTSIGVRSAPLTNKSDTPLDTQSSQQVLPASIGVKNAPLTNKPDTPTNTQSSQQVLPTSIGVRNAPLTNKSDTPLPTQSSQQVLPTSIGVRNAPLTNKSDTPLDTQSSQQVLPTSPDAYETDQLTNGDQMTQSAEMSPQYAVHHGLHPSHNPVVGEAPISMAPHLLNNQPAILNEGHPPSGVQIQKSELSTSQVETIRDNSGKQGSDHGNILSLETPAPSPSQPFDDYLKNNGPEASTVVMPEGHLPSSPCTKKVPHHDCEEASCTSSSSVVPNYVDSHSNAIDLSCLHPPPVPKRVYYSERAPREQVEVLNRSSKSDDAHSSQFHASDLLSDSKPEGPVTESGENLHDGNLLDPDEKPSISAKPFPADDRTVDNGFATHQMNKLLLDTNSEIKPNLSEHMGPKLKQALLSNEGMKDVETKDNHTKTLFDETETKCGKSDLPALHHVSSVERLDVIASNLPEIDWGEAYGKESNDNHMVQEQPVSLAGNVTNDVSPDFPPNVSKQVQGDILIDIDDRFPRELLSDMYSKAILQEDPSSHPLPADGIGYSVNMENHEPKSWSYFGKLAQGLDNVSLIDQDHLGFSHHATRQTTDRVRLDHEDSHLNFGEENQDLHRRIGAETHVLKSNYDQSQLNDTKSMQFDKMLENVGAQESGYKDGKFATKNCNLSSGNFDIGSVQVIKNEDLEELRELGSGTFGTVYHGKWRGSDVAIKRIKKSCFTGRSSEQERLTAEFWREADILSKLHHPNVVAFYGVVQDGPGGTMATVTEYMVDGSLRHVLLRKDRYLDLRKRLIIAMDAAFGMEYLHSKNIVHFDLKCDNLLVNLKDPLRPICKVGDFGLSKIKRNTLVTGGVRGTLPWMAPELLNGSSNKVSEKVDVFSFGILLWEILTGEEPYANMHYGAIIGGIVNNTLRPAIPSHCDLEWRTLMEQCWAPNPVARPSFTEIASRLRIMSAAASQTKPQGNKPSK